MRLLLILLAAFGLTAAACETQTIPLRSCPGSKPTTLAYAVSGSCGDDGVVTVSVGTADSCAINICEASGVQLPFSGTFNDLGASTNYVLGRGDWDLNDFSGGSMQIGTFLMCTGSAANAQGEIEETCEIESCNTNNDSDDVECVTGTTCTAHLVPTSIDAAIPKCNPNADLVTDAGTAIDGTAHRK